MLTRGMERAGDRARGIGCTRIEYIGIERTMIERIMIDGLV